MTKSLKKIKKPDAGADEFSTLVELAGEMAEAGQAAALGVLEAEVEALKALAEGAEHKDAAAQEARRREEEDEAEEGFDNMPV